MSSIQFIILLVLFKALLGRDIELCVISIMSNNMLYNVFLIILLSVSMCMLYSSDSKTDPCVTPK